MDPSKKQPGKDVFTFELKAEKELKGCRQQKNRSNKTKQTKSSRGIFHECESFRRWGRGGTSQGSGLKTRTLTSGKAEPKPRAVKSLSQSSSEKTDSFWPRN